MGGLPIGRARGGEAVAIYRGVNGELASVIERTVAEDSSVVDWGEPISLTVSEAFARMPTVDPQDVFVGAVVEERVSGNGNSRSPNRVDAAGAAFIDMLAPAGGGTDPGRWGELTDNRSSWKNISENWLGALVPGLAVIGSALAAGVETYSRTNSLSTAMIGAVMAPFATMAAFGALSGGSTIRHDNGDGLKEVRTYQHRLFETVIEIHDSYFVPAGAGRVPLTDAEKAQLRVKIAQLPVIWVVVLGVLEKNMLEMRPPFDKECQIKRYEALLALGLWPRPLDDSVLDFLSDNVGYNFDMYLFTEPLGNRELDVMQLFPQFPTAFFAKHHRAPTNEDIAAINGKLRKLPSISALILIDLFAEGGGDFLSREDADAINREVDAADRLDLFEKLDVVIDRP